MKYLAFALLLITALAGCFVNNPNVPDTRVDMTSADLVGIWRDRTGAEITFAENGTFTATNLPHQKFAGFTGVLPDGFDPQRDELPGSGTWKLEPPIGNSKGPRTVIDLHVRTLAGRATSGGTSMRAERAGSGPIILSFYIGDPDLKNKVIYEKCQVGCLTAAPTSS